MMRRILVLAMLITVSSSHAASENTNVELFSTSDLHQAACSEGSGKSDSPWHIKSLYNCETRSLFIPYQLWTGAAWGGDRDSNCTHKADSTFYVNGTSETKIKGPVEWKNPKTLETLKVWIREKSKSTKQQYFVCHNKGIGRVYDNRNGGRYFEPGRCKFPAGLGWALGTQRKCESTAIEINKIQLDSNQRLSALEFKWWYQNRHGEYVHDHSYRYEPNIGNVNAWKQ